MRDAAVKARRGGAHRATHVRWWQVVSAVVPVTLVAGAWGVAIGATPGGNAVDAASGNQTQEQGAPAVTDVPTNVFERPTARKAKSRQTRSTPLAGFDKAKATPASLRSAPLPSAAIDAYHDAAKVMADVKSSCKLDWTLIAAIGRVESNHGQYGGSTVASSGDTRPKIIGIPLDGTNNTATIHDTDNGKLDGDTTWDRAVGPMQFIPSTWDLIAVDGNGDGEKDPSNVYDAALGTAVYLCADGKDVSTESGASDAVFSYNHSNDYVATVLAIAEQYGKGNFTEEPSIYLPDTDPEDDVFDPGTSTDVGDGTDGSDSTSDTGDTKNNADKGPQDSDKLDGTHFGRSKAGGSAEQQVQQLEKEKDSSPVGGGAVVDPAVPDKDLLGQQTFETAPDSGNAPNPHGQSGPGKNNGFADNRPDTSKPKSTHKPKSKPKSKPNDDRIKSFSSGGKSGGPKSDAGVNVRPGRTDATSPNTTSNDTNKRDGATNKPKHGGATTDSKPKNTKKKNDTTSSDSTKPDSTKPDNTKPDNTKPDNTKPDNTKPDNTKPDKSQGNKQKSNDDTKKRRPKPGKLGSIKNAAEQTELCTKGTDQLRTEGTSLSDDQATRLVTTCVENFSVAASLEGDDPILNWLTTNVDEL